MGFGGSIYRTGLLDHKRFVILQAYGDAWIGRVKMAS